VLQNYPLRVLVGNQLRHGQLPLFDPYIWSGAPLLGGWNAGAAYPLTLLFAVMTGTAAWTINLIVTWWVAGLGTFAFLRASRLSPVACFVGGLSFAFAGAMAAQVAHFGFVAGMSWVPVVLLALLRLSERRDVRARLAWTAALAGACAMVILAGEPRAIDDGVVVAGLYALWRATRLRNRGRFAYGGLVTAGVALGVAIGAVQWLPGIDAVATSQRAAHSSALFNSGSLAPKWLLLSIVPDLLGGSGSFGQPSFFAHYSMSEITGYVGLLPLVAAFALLGRLRRRQRLPEWVIWHAIALVGVLLALGGNTVLGPVLLHLPLFGDQRLQSRNIMIADLALAVLLAYWVDVWLRAPQSARRRLPSARQLLGIVPPLAAVAVVTVTLAWGAGMLQWLGLNSSTANRAGPSAPWLVPFLVLGLGAIALVIWGPRLDRRRRARLVVCFVALDIGIFSLLTLVTVVPGLTNSPPSSVLSSSAAASGQVVDPTPPVVPISDLVHSGRFAIYDPNQYDPNELLELGVSDSNVATGTPSVEGYSSIVDSTYAQVTGSHQSMGEGQYVLDPKVLSDGTLDQLDTTVLLTPSAYLITSVDPDSASTDGQTGRRQLAPGQSGSWYLGTQLEATSVTIPFHGTPTADGAVRVGLVEESGSTLWKTPVAVPGDGLSVSINSPRDIVALKVVAGASPLDLGAPVVQTVNGESYQADGQLQDLIVAPRWHLRDFDGAFAVFGDSMARPALSLQALPGQSTAGASVRAAGGPAFAPTRAQVTSPEGVTIVRAAAAIPGSTASWYRAGSSTTQVLRVHRSGVVQSVTVPAGRGTVVWRYIAPGAALGLWLTIGGLVGAVGLGLALVVTRRRRSSASAPPRMRLVGLAPARLIDASASANVLGHSVSQSTRTSSLD
jgi:hypothetical protein